MAARWHAALVALGTLLIPLAGAPAEEGAAGGSAPAARDALRCVVLVTIDTLRADHVGAYGGPVATPALDALAAEGVLIERAFTPTPTTGPAHASLLTGLHPWRHRVLNNAVPLRGALTTLAEVAHAHGVATGAFVSSYIVQARFGFDAGFDEFVFDARQAVRWRGKRRDAFWARGERTTGRAMQWLNEQAAKPSERFLLWVHYFDPHMPYRPPPGYALRPDAPVDLRNKSMPAGMGGPRQLARLIRSYRGEVRYADAQVGRLLERLRLLGLEDRTAVVVTADHGEGLGDHGVLDHGINLHDELVRVPLIVRAPGLPAGRRLAGDAQLEDLFPTILALLDLPVPGGLDGLDLLPWLRGEVERSPREAVVGRRKVYVGKPVLYYGLRGRSKWIGALDRAGEVYALESDPAELAGAPGHGPPEWLRARLDGSGVETEEEQAAPDLDAETRRALEALGYAE